MKKSTQKLKKITRVLFGRTAFVIIAILMQFAFFFILINWLYRYSVLIHLLFVLLGMFVVIHIFNEDTNSAFKMAWIIPVLIIPIFGTMIYVFVNLQLGTKIMRSRLASIDKQLHEKAKTSDAVLEKLESELHGERGLAYIMPVTFRHIMIMILSSFRLASSSLKR
jgi:cardiolipin synthase